MPGQQAAANSVMQQANQNLVSDQNYATADERGPVHNSNGFNAPNIGGNIGANEYQEYGLGANNI